LTTFSDFGLVAPIQKALATEGYTTPTPIQIKAIPDAMAGRDLLGIAQTGTGKTAAFALPILHRLAQAPAPRQPKRCRVLVLSPTRELASQIADSFCAYGRNLRLATTVVFGGVPIGRQERALASGVDILVATPGRLLDLVDRRSLDLRELEILVLDEADQMLDLGFIHDLKRIVRLIPAKRQSLFFSATMPKSIAALADEYLTDPVKVAVTPVATTAERVDQHVLFVPTARKQALLQSVLQDPAIERTLVFTRTKHGADRVVRHLLAAGIEAAAIHGNKSQNQRERALNAFRDGNCRVLVATDIAARGIDVEGVTHVINFELPNVPESYVHRIGRTARAGAAGVAISFCNEEERAYLRDIEKLTRLKVPVMPAPAGLDLAAVEPQQGNRTAEREPRREARRPQQPQKQQSKRQPSARHNEASQQRQSRDGRHMANGGHRNDNHASRGGGSPAMKRGRAQRSDRGGHAENGGNSIAWLARSR
jgi:ATP-dependent RNA helicase RhlE